MPVRVNNNLVRSTLNTIGRHEVALRREMAGLRKRIEPEAPSVLITGGAGNVGSNIVIEAMRKGFNPSILDSLVNGHIEICDITGVKFFPVDLREYCDVLGAMTEFYPKSPRHKPKAAVVHAASLIEVGQSEREKLRYAVNNIGGGLHLLDAMSEVGCLRLLFSNTAAIYRTSTKPLGERALIEPKNIYALTKAFLNHVLESVEYGIRATSLNYFNVFGSTDERCLREDHGIGSESHLIPIAIQVAIYNLISRMGLKLSGYDAESIAQSYLEGNRRHLTVLGKDYATPDGTCIRDYIDMDTMLYYHMAALNRLFDCSSRSDYLRCNLGTKTGRSVLEIINTVENVIRKELGIPIMSKKVLEDLNSGERIIPVQIGDRRPGDADKLVANPAKAQRLFGSRKTVENDFERAVANAFWAMLYRPLGYSSPPAVSERNPVLRFYTKN
ncbi:MAG: NAD-dependent epimerase/dehydratase family protein [Candidatus Margulisiibacteriota bacterium]